MILNVAILLLCAGTAVFFGTEAEEYEIRECPEHGPQDIELCEHETQARPECMMQCLMYRIGMMDENGTAIDKDFLCKYLKECALRDAPEKVWDRIYGCVENQTFDLDACTGYDELRECIAAQ